MAQAARALMSVLTTMGGERTPEPVKPTGPLLKELQGMADARIWGEQLAQDLADYLAKRIPWSAVDRGAVLHGEPGTGKTTALAATCKVTPDRHVLCRMAAQQGWPSRRRACGPA